ncbi:hypothetical protein CAAN1_05S03246 [[Candida] anglica]|uniref:Uncharacterized protein n=1 Tax=[Candida] anglica TaxID=148631 RepID=A0ABP0EE65_9ASCO
MYTIDWAHRPTPFSVNQSTANELKNKHHTRLYLPYISSALKATLFFFARSHQLVIFKPSRIQCYYCTSSIPVSD